MYVFSVRTTPVDARPLFSSVYMFYVPYADTPCFYLICPRTDLQ